MNEPDVQVEKLNYEIKKRWDPKKLQSTVLAYAYDHLADDLGFSVQKIERVSTCGDFLEFHNTNNGYKLKMANFCRDRLCPMCQWRRSLKMFSQVSRCCDYIISQSEYKDVKFAFLTLTVRNSKDQDLKKTIDLMLSGFNKLTHKTKLFQKSIVLGSMRSLEITYNSYRKDWHPHLHIILVLAPEYFDSNYYLTQKRWSELWANCIDADYHPVVDIRLIKSYHVGQDVKLNHQAINSAVAEVAKYSVKGSDFLDPEDLAFSEHMVKILHPALAGRRLYGFTGIFNEVRKQLQLDDVDDGDLVHVEDESVNVEIAEQIIRYRWKAGGYAIMKQ